MRNKSQKAWELKNPEKVKEMRKREYLKNKAKYQAYKKAKYLENREEILKKWHENYVPHPRVLKTREEIKEKVKSWRYQNKENYNAYMKDWNRKNRERLLPLRREYYHNRLSVNVQYTRLIATAKERNYEQTLSKEKFIEIISKPCTYCGEKVKRIGIDRLENSKGYTIENSVACCKICNYMKKTLSLSDFLSHIEKIYSFNKKSP